jgi:hypothetical protein
VPHPHFPADPSDRGWRRAVGLVAVHPVEELALGGGVAPGVGLEPLRQLAIGSLTDDQLERTATNWYS